MNVKERLLQTLHEAKSLLERDSYNLTRTEQDSIFYRIQQLEEHISNVYAGKNSADE